LKVENIEILTSLLRDRKVGVLHPRHRVYRGVALFSDVMDMFQNPTVGIQWPIAIKEYLTELHRTFPFSPVDRSIVRILCAAFRRRGITADMLNQLFPTENNFEVDDELTMKEIAFFAYTSGNVDVVRWAASRGFVPTHQQLKDLKNLLGDSL
jgi:hypothetical protein